jgi:hypothetical protein
MRPTGWDPGTTRTLVRSGSFLAATLEFRGRRRERERPMAETMVAVDLRAAWERAFRWERYLEDEVREHAELWRGVWARASVAPEALARAAGAGGPWRMLVISEDWCCDASNTVPVMARLAASLPNLEMRVAKRDASPELMDAFLTGTSRSIPLAIVLREDFSVAGRWGPRPPELQRWVLAETARGGLSKREIYREIRRWYARDRGESTVEGIVEVMERG